MKQAAKIEAIVINQMGCYAFAPLTAQQFGEFTGTVLDGREKAEYLAIFIKKSDILANLYKGPNGSYARAMNAIEHFVPDPAIMCKVFTDNGFVELKEELVFKDSFIFPDDTVQNETAEVTVSLMIQNPLDVQNNERWAF
jgi:adenosine deaminase